MSYWQWLIGRLNNQLWWKAVAFGALGVVVAAIGLLAELLVPYELPIEISREAVSGLLNIIASSMLAVTTFSVGAMTSAFGAATSHVTPRATTLLMQDRVTHNVLSTFISAFVFSIFGLVMLNVGAYGSHGRAVLFVATMVVLFLIVVQLLRWVNHLMSLGRMGTTIERLEEVTKEALTQRQSQPYLGAYPWWPEDPLPPGTSAICSKKTGVVQFVDMAELSDLAEAHDLRLFIPVNAGAMTFHHTVLAYVEGPLTPELEVKISDNFIIGATRTFEQDPRFGLMVLAEVATGALAPSKGDAGTALDIIARLTRLLTLWSEGRDDTEVAYPRLALRPLADEDLFEDAFMIIARDGAHMIEVQTRLQKSLNALSRLGSAKFRKAAAIQSDMALERALHGLEMECDRQRLQKVVADLSV